ncbi:acyl-CoA thioesterase [Blastopirellula marina]|uniref:Thioesterase n=1 Tax=Blastopirellula marina TaxID=124 RepID=A0A2S8G1M1_9BACT|nr:thioesterase family protein [Blastopirellula marina]PQO38323.1 thioesterase [Blastopirellula marina]PTL44979.1 acyl-CoA thioesterase [Blastopirellula marina]
MLTEHTIEVRVRYQETDAQGRVHHANYITYFELARTEMLRAGGFNYKRMEEEGLLLVVRDVQCRYHLPAEFDDLLQVTVKTVKAKGARIELNYEIRRDDDVIVEGSTLLACITREGKPTRIPAVLRVD